MTLTPEEIIGDAIRHRLHKDCDLMPMVTLPESDRAYWRQEGAALRAWLDGRGLMIRAKV